MMPPPSAILYLLATLAVPPPAVREERAAAVWMAPQFVARGLGEGQRDVLGSRTSILPLGLEMGRQLTPRLMVSAALAGLPSSDGATTQAMLAARWFLLDRPLAPYLSASAGAIGDSINNIATRTSPFVAAGGGAELALHNGLSAMAGIRVGPENRQDGFGRRWQLSAWTYLGIGYRF